MESNNHNADTALEAWNELYSALKGVARERSLEFRRPEEFSVLIQNKGRRGSLRVWFLPELKKLRYNAGMGWQELTAIDRGGSSQWCFKHRSGSSTRFRSSVTSYFLGLKSQPLTASPAGEEGPCRGKAR